MTERVLVVRADSLGDVVLTGPAVRAIAASGAEVTMLCSPRGEPAARRLPGVRHLIVARLPWIDPEPDDVKPAAMQTVIAAVERGRFDSGVIFTSFHQSALPTALLLRMAGVRRLGAISIDYPGSLLDVSMRHDKDMHEVERSLELVGAMGYRLPADDDRTLVLRRCSPLPLAPPENHYVVVHPGASVPARTWAPAKWADATAALSRTRAVVVTGSRDEIALTASVAGAHRRPIDLGGALDLDQLLAVFAAADVVITGNTGPAHLAAAARTPVVSVFAPTVSPARWRPWGVPFEMLGNHAIPCAGCRSTACPVPGQPCIAGVTTTDVVDAVRRLAPARSLTVVS